MSALGDEFRNAREARGLTLSDVAERLHIRSVYLAAIEDEDWPVIGAPVYVRGFMRTYARFLGLDAEAAVARFSAAAPAVAAPGTAARPAASARPAAGEGAGERRSPSLGAILAIVVAVVAVAFVGYEFYAYRSGPPVVAGPAAVDASPDAADASAPATAADALPVAAASTAPRVVAVKPGAKHGLGLQVTEASWVRVVVDGKVAYEGTLPAGAAKSFRGSAVDVRVGNAGGVKLVVDGRPLGPLGASGDVVERHFALSGE